MTGTALAEIADMGTYRGQISHYSSVKRRLGVGVAARAEPKATVVALNPERVWVRLPHEFWYIGERDPKKLYSPTQRIIADVCEKHKVSRPELFGLQRGRGIVKARHEAYYRMKKETTMSLAQIGVRMGGKDHSTILNGVSSHMRREGLES